MATTMSSTAGGAPTPSAIWAATAPTWSRLLTSIVEHDVVVTHPARHPLTEETSGCGGTGRASARPVLFSPDLHRGRGPVGLACPRSRDSAEISDSFIATGATTMSSLLRRRRQPDPRPRRGGSSRFAVESLERRQLLSTWIVTDTTDSASD